MFYPAQTSMMPVAVALARFWENGFFLTGWYPYWYLGVPHRFLGGPVVPATLAVLHKFFPGLTLFDIYFLLIAFFWIFGGVTLYLLVKKLGGKFWTGVLTVIVFIFGPFLPLIFPFSDGLSLIAFSFLPLILLNYISILKQWSRFRAIIISILIALSLLIDNLILPVILLGLISILLTIVSWEAVEKQIKRTILVVIFSLVLTTVWYSPSYWWHIWFTSSFAGKGVGSVAILVIKLFLSGIPIILAVFSVKKIWQKKSPLLNFALFWSFIFGFLTLIRFLSDPDFWQDWTSYILEIQMGGAILLAIFIGRLLRSEKLQIFPRSFFLVGVSVLLFLPWILAPNKFLGIRSSIQNSIEYRMGKWLTEHVKTGERVYLSGTTAFWLNSFFNVSQVRGGVDQGATHPFWARASYEIREGQNPEIAENWLQALGVSYLVIHPSTSSEYYHDFKYPDKFDNRQNLKKVFSDRDSIIYQVEGSSLARVVDLVRFKKLKPLKDGADNQNLSAYTSLFGRQFESQWLGLDKVLLQGRINSGEGVVVALTWDRGWKCKVKNLACRIEKDIMGNILIDPGNSGDMEINLELLR